VSDNDKVKPRIHTNASTDCLPKARFKYLVNERTFDSAVDAFAYARSVDGRVAFLFDGSGSSFTMADPQQLELSLTPTKQSGGK